MDSSATPAPPHHRARRAPFAMVRALGARLGLQGGAQSVLPAGGASPHAEQVQGQVQVQVDNFAPPAPGAASAVAPPPYRPREVAALPVQADAGESLIFAPVVPGAADALVEITLHIAATRAELGRYLYSKLYYSTGPAMHFTEAAVVCFEVRERGRDERIQLALPPAAWDAARASGYLRLRVDGLPYAHGGSWRVASLGLVGEAHDAALAHSARRVAHRQWVREQVRVSESQRRVALPHYPESVSIELTPVCNLRCPHCSSHGMPHLHRHHNCSPEMPVERLRRLAQETFPHVSVVSLVGRGEPTLASDALWAEVVAQLRAHDVRMSCVTNGTRVRQRFDAALMPWVHELIFSIDGNTAETFEHNRAGARFDVVLENLRYYHELRNTVPLSRRPQLTVSWTLKRNNIAELPGFVQRIAPFEPDLISLRHLVVFQDKERGESLLDCPEEANRHLRAAYAELDRLGLRHESPPLMMVGAPAPPQPAAVQAPGAAARACAAAAAAAQPAPAPTWDRATSIALREPECNWMHRTAIVMADGEVITCGKHYGEQVGHLTADNTLWDLWNGPRMLSLRESFGKPHMWDQCKDCWLRELKWHSQRQAKDLSATYSLGDGMDFSEAAWDYRRYAEL